MSAGEQGDHQPLHHVLLADDDPTHLRQGHVDQSGRLLVVHLCPSRPAIRTILADRTSIIGHHSNDPSAPGRAPFGLDHAALGLGGVW
ncbi:hypothetical protein SDC9_163148 [bioreactor metagenome]|uniref:Uncharacterized protein n=1 Tax=bioreactor metagenome TaxID=1076179 RepID=A0A645FQD6_9ZZZZ